MAANDFSRFHELAEQLRGEMPLKKICEQEGVSYRSYIAWRSRKGFAPRRRTVCPVGSLVEMEASEVTTTPVSPKATAIHIMVFKMLYERHTAERKGSGNIGALLLSPMASDFLTVSKRTNMFQSFF